MRNSTTSSFRTFPRKQTPAPLQFLQLLNPPRKIRRKTVQFRSLISGRAKCVTNLIRRKLPQHVANPVCILPWDIPSQPPHSRPAEELVRIEHQQQGGMAGRGEIDELGPLFRNELRACVSV